MFSHESLLLSEWYLQLRPHASDLLRVLLPLVLAPVPDAALAEAGRHAAGHVLALVAPRLPAGSWPPSLARLQPPAPPFMGYSDEDSGQEESDQDDAEEDDDAEGASGEAAPIPPTLVALAATAVSQLEPLLVAPGEAQAWSWSVLPAFLALLASDAQHQSQVERVLRLMTQQVQALSASPPAVDVERAVAVVSGVARVLPHLLPVPALERAVAAAAEGWYEGLADLVDAAAASSAGNRRAAGWVQLRPKLLPALAAVLYALAPTFAADYAEDFVFEVAPKLKDPLILTDAVFACRDAALLGSVLLPKIASDLLRALQRSPPLSARVVARLWEAVGRLVCAVPASLRSVDWAPSVSMSAFASLAVAAVDARLTAMLAQQSTAAAQAHVACAALTALARMQFAAWHDGRPYTDGQAVLMLLWRVVASTDSAADLLVTGTVAGADAAAKASPTEVFEADAFVHVQVCAVDMFTVRTCFCVPARVCGIELHSCCALVGPGFLVR